jgi:protein TonB
MQIQGDLATYEFSDLLQWLAQGHKTGTLTISGCGVEYRLGFDHGSIDMTASSDPKKHLDRYLFGRGVIDEATLERASRLREATQMMSGQVLVTLGAVTPHQLANALRDKTEEILCELLTWDRGAFEFLGGERPDSAMVPVNLEVTKLLLESMHRLDQQNRDERPVADERSRAAFAKPTDDKLPATTGDAGAGLALAEVVDPATAGHEVVAVSTRGPILQGSAAESQSYYATMARSLRPMRRLLAFAVTVVVCLTAAGLYLVNRQASAQSVEAGEPILFSQTSVPLPIRAESIVSAPPEVSPGSRGPIVTESSEPPAEVVLRQQYEAELARLRRELEEARRMARVDTAAASVELPSQSRITAKPHVGRSVADAPAGAADQVPAAGPMQGLPASEASPAEPDASEAMTVEPLDVAPEASWTPAGSEAESTYEESLAGGAGPVLSFVGPSLVTRPTPDYPVFAQRRRRGATVTVRLFIGADGRVEEAAVKGPKVGMGFDRAAEKAARASTWEPGTRDGVPTAMWTELRFNFRP